MSESQSDRFFSMLEHAIVPVRATKFAEVEIGLYFNRRGQVTFAAGSDKMQKKQAGAPALQARKQEARTNTSCMQLDSKEHF